nr:Actin cytoskeleton-regulatory complex protein [Ipomoea batatas]
MARFAFCYAVILGMLVAEAMASGSADLEAYPRKLLGNRSLLATQQSRTEGSVADPPAPGGQDSSPEGKGDAGAPESVETAEHHHSDKSVAGGGVIIGGLVTAIFAAVYCYIRVTRKRVNGDQRSVY